MGDRKVRSFALQDVSLQIASGAVTAIIGGNGSGKSTLLRLLAGILVPTAGEIFRKGKVTTLLSLGMGFRDQLTGRENAVLGGVASGIRLRPVINALPSIAHFSGLGDYFDQPLKTYSTGMRTRLAFAVATEFVQGSLVIDEALSAGDSQFSKQAEVRLNKLLDEDRTVVLVSHSMSAVKNLADSCIWLHEGRVAMQGSTKEVIGAYQAQNM